MTINDIRFTGYTTIANCESEPIHIPGTIQPYGVLLVINIQTHIIDFCSANTLAFLGIAVKDILGKTLEEIIGEEEGANIYQQLKDSNPQQFYTLTFRSDYFCTSLFIHGNLLLLEIERFPEKTLSLPDLYQQSRNFINYLEKSNDLQELCTHLVNEIRDITGYDRVMVYRFDKEFNGEVYAESVNDGIESFLGLNYPHTDIPPQARALFAHNLLRMIPDVYYQPVPVMTLIKEATNKSLDMSSGGLRSVSPIHIEYLKNMGVGASLTISLIHNKKLWGLIACHHSLPKNLPPYTRLSLKLHAHFLTSQISNREATSEFESATRINEKMEAIIKIINKSEIEYYKNNPQLYECIDADGMAVITEENIYMAGKTPRRQQIVDLAIWMDSMAGTDYFVTNRLEEKYPDGVAIKDTASGVFFHSLYKSGKRCVLWFKGESKRVISWAGDPVKAVETSKDFLMPRKSFALWKQVVANTSTDWEKPAIDAAIRLSTSIQNNIFLTNIIKEEKRYRLQTNELEKVNDELKSFNHICSHDLQEPLRKIQMFSTMLLSDTAGETDVILKKINISARRAVKQVKDLLELAGISNFSDVMTEIDLDQCLENIKADFELIINEKNAVISYRSLGFINGIPVQVEQLLHNLIGNALKFSHEQNCHISVSLRNASTRELKENTGLDIHDEYICLEISDNGIGFDQKFAKDIFNIFYRLNDFPAYAGSGIGLAICKKIADNHKGRIFAKSRKGYGTSFYVYLKKY